MTIAQASDSSSLALGCVSPYPYERYRQVVCDGKHRKANRSIDEMKAAASAFVEEFVAEYRPRGLAVGLVANGKLAFTSNYGPIARRPDADPIDEHTIFQIASVTKTFIALGIALLVDDGKLHWSDPVLQHIPWLKLANTYVQENLQIGDLLDMNSGFACSQGDEAMFAGLDETEKAFVERLQHLVPDAALRSGFAYANINTIIAGQVIQCVTNTTWGEFLTERVFKPLGMTRTFPSISHTDGLTNVAEGHLVWKDQVRGPFDLLSDPKVDIVPAFEKKELATGSMVSSVSDMAKFMSLMTSNGTVDGVTIIKNPYVLSEMTMSRVQVDLAMKEQYAAVGDFPPMAPYQDIATGYGFDSISHCVWGRKQASKAGDTFAHKTRMMVLPEDGIGVIMLSNAQVAQSTVPFGLALNYLAGIYLDIPKEYLDADFAIQKQAAANLVANTIESLVGHGMECSADFYDLSHTKAIPHAEQWTGTYESTTSPVFYGHWQMTADTAYGSVFVKNHFTEGNLTYVDKLPTDSPLAANFDNREGHILLFSNNSGLSSYWYTGNQDGERVVQLDKLTLKMLPSEPSSQ